MGNVDILHAAVDEGATRVRPWIRRMARVGLAARGLTYLMVGVLAARKAFGQGGGQTIGTGEAVEQMGNGAFGDVLLALIAAGLIGYGLWRCIQAIHDTEGKGSDAKALAVRAIYLGKGLVHFALAATPIKLLMDEPQGNGGVQSTTARALSHEAGPWIVAAFGAIVVGAGIYQVFKGVRRKFVKNLDDARMGATARAWAHRAGTFGYVARGVTFGVIGWFLIEAGRQADPGEARGLGEALDVLLRQAYGPWLMGLVALGLASYGLFSFVEAKYRRIRT